MYAEIPREGNTCGAETGIAISRPGDRAVLSKLPSLAGEDREVVPATDFCSALQNRGRLARTKFGPAMEGQIPGHVLAGHRGFRAEDQDDFCAWEWFAG